MKIVPISFMVLFMVSTAACWQKQKVVLHDLSWILGTWQVDNEDQFEEWIKINESLYRGKTYKLRNNDTLIQEIIELVHNEQGVFYVPQVTNQNDGNPISFRLVSYENKLAIFENKLHDFPQRIEYHFQSDSMIQAWIKGIEKDRGFRNVGFLLQKIDRQ